MRRAWTRGRFGIYEQPTRAEQEQRARAELRALSAKGRAVEPVHIEGNAIAATFWGKGWCRHMEGFSDYASRLPRGRAYVRSGAVVHLAIEPGRIQALVRGRSTYEVAVTVAALDRPRWDAIREASAHEVGSLIDLLEGRLSGAVMKAVTDRAQGLFPQPGEIELRCSCPDWATLCKHVAAVLYGVGARLDAQPELLFRLRGVDPAQLVGSSAALGPMAAPELSGSELGEIFGIDLDTSPAPTMAAEPAAPKRPARRRRATRAPRPRLAEITVTELARAGATLGDLEDWLRDGTLRRTPSSGVYVTTGEQRERLLATGRAPRARRAARAR